MPVFDISAHTLISSILSSHLNFSTVLSWDVFSKEPPADVSIIYFLAEMKRWRINCLLLVAILSTCLVTISANDDEDDDGVTIETEQVVIKAMSKHGFKCKLTGVNFYRKIQSQHTKRWIHSSTMRVHQFSRANSILLNISMMNMRLKRNGWNQRPKKAATAFMMAFGQLKQQRIQYWRMITG